MEEQKIEFEKFLATGGKFADRISLNKAGGFSFSAGFCRKHNIGQYPYVMLHYSKNPKAVGFTFLKEPTKGAFKISFTKSKTASLRPNSFMAAYEIDYKNYTNRYEPKIQTGENGEEIFFIILNENK